MRSTSIKRSLIMVFENRRLYDQILGSLIYSIITQFTRNHPFHWKDSLVKKI